MGDQSPLPWQLVIGDYMRKVSLIQLAATQELIAVIPRVRVAMPRSIMPFFSLVMVLMRLLDKSTTRLEIAGALRSARMATFVSYELMTMTIIAKLITNL